MAFETAPGGGGGSSSDTETDTGTTEETSTNEETSRRPTGVAGPDQTPDSDGFGGPSGNGSESESMDPDRPTGVAGPDDEPGGSGGSNDATDRDQPDRDTSQPPRDDDPETISDAEQQDINAALAEDVPGFREKQQGIETGAGDVARQARALEQDFLARYPYLRARDVAIERDGNTIRTRLTATGNERLGRNPTTAEYRDAFLTRLPDRRDPRDTDRRVAEAFGDVARTDVGDLDRDTQQVVNTSFIRQRSQQLSAFGRRQRRVLGSDMEFGIEDIGNLPREQQGELNSELIRQRSQQLSAFKRQQRPDLREDRVDREAFGDHEIPIPKYLPVTGVVGINAGGGVVQNEEKLTFEDVNAGLARRIDRTIQAFSSPDAAAVPGTATASVGGLTLVGTSAVPAYPGTPEYEVARGTTESALSLANVPATARAADEGLETAGFLAYENISGRGGEANQAAATEAERRAIAALDYAKANPYRVGAGLAASSVFTAGSIGAASRVSGGAGRAVSFAIQPGEELVRGAARAGAVSTRTASVVPGVTRRNIGAVDGSGVSLPGVRNRLPDVRSKLPEVSVRYDPDAGPLELDPQLARDIRDAVTPDRPLTRQRVASPADELLMSPLRGRVAGAQLSAEVAATNIRRRLREGDLSSPLNRPQRPEINVREEVGGRVRGGILSAEAAVTNVRRRVGDIQLPRRRRSRDDLLMGPVEGATAGAQLTGEAAVTNALRRVENIELPDRPRRSSSALLMGRVRGRVAGEQLSAEAAVANARNRVGNIQRPRYDLPDPDIRGEIAGALQGAQLSAEAAVTNTRRRASGTVMSARQAVQPQGRLRDLTVEVRSPNSPPRPQRTVLDEEAFKTGDVGEFETDIPTREADLEPDTPSASGGGGSSDARLVRGPQQQTRLKTVQATEPLMETSPRRTPISIEPGARAGSMTDSSAITDLDVGDGTSVRPPDVELSIERDVVADVEMRVERSGEAQDTVATPEVKVEPVTENSPRLDPAIRQEFDIENRQETSADLDLRQEVRAEVAVEARPEPARERPGIGLDGGDGTSRRRQDPFAGDEERYEYRTRELL